MKKKILIFSHAMELGGAERSLLGLLEALDPACYEIDLFLMRHEGELLTYIPDTVNLLPEKKAYTVLGRPMKDTIREGHLLLTAARLWGKMAANRFAKKQGLSRSDAAIEYSHKYTKALMPKINPSVTYDLAISFLTPHYFVAEKVQAKKKIAWIHTDYSGIRIDVDSERKMWSAYDQIVSISDAVTKSFLSIFPEFQSRILLIENILPEKTILRQMEEQSRAGEQMAEGQIRLLSIGRFCEAKNFDNVPAILREIRTQGLDAHWYLLGFGPDEELIRTRIREASMEKYVHLLAKTPNPYPYIKACDVYLQPSRYEGRCVTVKEAQMLGKPVIITRYATSASQLEEGVDGFIVEMGNPETAAGIAALLKQPEELWRVATACAARSYSNMEEAKKISAIMDETYEDKNNHLS